MKTKMWVTKVVRGGVAFVFLLAAVVVAGAQQEHDMGGMRMGDAPYDLHFIDMMMMHHQQGIEMARLAQEKGQSAKVKAFAAKTAADQQKDIEELRGDRERWYAGQPEMDRSQMMAHMPMMMPGHGGMKMDPQADMAKLRAADGREFDRLFLDTMTMHHQMAIEMSRDASRKAQHPELRQFASKAAAKQTGEIAEMRRIRAGLGSAPKGKTKRAAKPSAHAGHMHDHK